MNEWLSQLGQQLPQIALGFLAARQGGPQAAAAFQQGLYESQQRREGLARQAQLDEERRAAQAAQEARAQNVETRAADAATRAEEAARVDRVQSALQYLDRYAQQQGETAPDAVAAENALLGRASSLEGMFNVPQGQLSAAVPNMAPTISRRQKKLAEETYARAEKTYGAEAMANDSITLTVEPFGQVKPSQLRVMFMAPAVTATGEPAKPFVPPAKTDKRGFATKDVTVNGKRMLAGFDPDTNQYYAPGGITMPLTGDIQEYQKPSATGTGTPKPMTQGQRANVVITRRREWTAANKPVREREQAIAKMDSGLAALDRGNRPAATEIIVIAFEKMQDEASVVREAEYGRPGEMQAIGDRISAALTKLKSGGSNLTDANLRALAAEGKALSRAVNAISSEYLAELRRGIEEELTEYGIPASRVFGGTSAKTETPDPAKSARDKLNRR